MVTSLLRGGSPKSVALTNKVQSRLEREDSTSADMVRETFPESASILYVSSQTEGMLETISYMIMPLLPESASVATTEKTVWLTVEFSGTNTRLEELGKTGALSLMSVIRTIKVVFPVRDGWPLSVAVMVSG